MASTTAKATISIDIEGLEKLKELNREIEKFECEFEEMQERMNRVREKMNNWEPRLIRKR
ncbi:hypothetical protein [Brevibacillus laterosporus]|uniref:Uncharacterized protein n=1 Tax=Brevibacillus laterosporus TaxID=1465 RepID=A0AAP3DM72_BRELA|nr:hypothetical protein [Brevibacillus laterosporus]MCR8982654.1 hypothetical protein [Brevibacillus laterosporus]MCZ0809810.1 hypothetical protein [Brevibacillus laterosporus]MCZ0828356.1 hypothetical protein [Brevibacillus laterosporus]MCZ0852366.1 hypothetical protein [Brevibacillus laterosporus]